MFVSHSASTFTLKHSLVPHNLMFVSHSASTFTLKRSLVPISRGVNGWVGNRWNSTGARAGTTGSAYQLGHGVRAHEPLINGQMHSPRSDLRKAPQSHSPATVGGASSRASSTANHKSLAPLPKGGEGRLGTAEWRARSPAAATLSGPRKLPVASGEPERRGQARPDRSEERRGHAGPAGTVGNMATSLTGPPRTAAAPATDSCVRPGGTIDPGPCGGGREDRLRDWSLSASMLTSSTFNSWTHGLGSGSSLKELPSKLKAYHEAPGATLCHLAALSQSATLSPSAAATLTASPGPGSGGVGGGSDGSLS